MVNVKMILVCNNLGTMVVSITVMLKTYHITHSNITCPLATNLGNEYCPITDQRPSQFLLLQKTESRLSLCCTPKFQRELVVKVLQIRGLYPLTKLIIFRKFPLLVPSTLAEPSRTKPRLISQSV